jgi:hypothetical protein
MTSTNKQLNTSIGGMLYYERQAKQEAAKEDYLKNIWFLKG